MIHTVMSLNAGVICSSKGYLQHRVFCHLACASRPIAAKEAPYSPFSALGFLLYFALKSLDAMVIHLQRFSLTS